MKIIIAFLISILLTSCGMTDIELSEKNKYCKELGMIAKRTFGGKGYCIVPQTHIEVTNYIIK